MSLAEKIQAFYLQACNGDRERAYTMACQRLAELLTSGFDRTMNQSTRNPKPDPPEPIQ